MAKELNNLEKALSAIAKNTKAAKDTAAEAKEMAAPAKITTAVNGTLSEVETAAKVAALQAKHETGMKLAVERGVYYLEDALTEELREKVLSGFFKTNKQTPAEAAVISRAVTEYIDRIPNGSYITARQGSVFSVDKNVGYKPDVFGADGRKVTVGGMTLTIDGAQPCISAISLIVTSTSVASCLLPSLSASTCLRWTAAKVTLSCMAVLSVPVVGWKKAMSAVVRGCLRRLMDGRPKIRILAMDMRIRVCMT